MDFNIITFHTALSHGAVLQALGLKSFIEQMGYTVGVYDYRPQKYNNNNKIKTFLLEIAKRTHKSDIDIIHQNFADFTGKHLNLNLDENPNVFLSGSDQVWNANGSMDPMFYLQFVGEKTIRASYAASMGKTSIPEQRTELFRRYINYFDFLSVREPDAKVIIENIVERKDVQVHIDPSLLHRKDFWIKFATPVKNLPENYILVYPLRKPKNINLVIDWLKKETGKQVVLADSSGLFSKFIHNDIVYHNVGPAEFLWLISHADSVITTSFHGAAFSLLFQKELYSILDLRNPSRVKNLMDMCKIPCISEEETSFERITSVDWEQIEKKLETEREKSRAYIKMLYETDVRTLRKKYRSNVSCYNDSCSGCGVCSSICPKEAIKMIYNAEGFLEPKIDESICTNCGACMKVCPISTHKVNKRIESYFGWNHDKGVCQNSSSGAIFHALAMKMIRAGGIVYGAKYTEDFYSVKASNTDTTSLLELQKSKYVVSDYSKIYREVKNELEQNRKVLFTGAPCQCAALKNYLIKDYDNLIICDFICGGFPSKRFFEEHIRMFETKFDSKVTSIDFRSKEKGWGKVFLRIKFENGESIGLYDYQDRYLRAFCGKHISVRETCLSCQFASRHASDITFGDFWAYKAAGAKYRKDGLSLITANTDKGKLYLNSISGIDLTIIDNHYSDYTFRYKVADNVKIEFRRRFMERSLERGFETASQEMLKIGLVNKCLEALKYKLHIK